MSNDIFDTIDGAAENLAEGGTWLLDVVAAVDHLRRGHRPGLTVWDAIAEAIRGDSQPITAPTLDDVVVDALRTQRAIRWWVTTMAERYNNGHHWPHPMPRRRFPPPLLAVDDDLSGADRSK